MTINTEFMVEELVKEMALRLMEEEQLSMIDALDSIYNSDTYSKLIDLESGLFAQSTAYVYEYLIKELKTGKM